MRDKNGTWFDRTRIFPQGAAMPAAALPRNLLAWAVAVALGFAPSTQAVAPTALLVADRGRIPPMREEYLFIDGRVAEPRWLAAAARPGVHTVIVDPSRDGVAQITTTLAGAARVDAIHLVTHGAAGSLQLGSVTLDEAALGRYRDQLQLWFAARNSARLQPDLLLYGCAVAAGSGGKSFLAALAAATGADVAASDDVTGGSQLGLNWTLEWASGRIEAGLPIAPAAAAAWPHALGSFTVSNTNDSGAGSLRDAVAQSNAAAGPDSIVFQSGLSGTITLSGAPLSLLQDTSIVGPGAQTLTIAGAGNGPVLGFAGGNRSSVSGLTITGGRSVVVADRPPNTPAADRGFAYPCGGGISASGVDLSVDRVVITGNSAFRGGGICLQATTGNTDAHLTLSNSTLSGNQATGKDGGALYFGGFYAVAEVSNSTFTGNTSYYSGGAIGTEQAGRLVVTDSVFTGNRAMDVANGGGGAIFVDDVVSGAQISGSTISGNRADHAGGGTFFYNESAGAYVIDNCRISGNRAEYFGGGSMFLYAFGPNQELAIRNSSITGNEATQGLGGGVFQLSTDGTEFVIENSTVSGNVSAGPGAGLFVYYSSGISANSGSFFHLRGLTVTDNNSTALGVHRSTRLPNGGFTYGTGIHLAYGAGLALENSIVANNIGNDVGGSTIRAAASLIRTVTTNIDNSAGGNKFGLDPRLGVLSANGGIGLSQLPLAGSPAIDAGRNALTGPLAFDQRGAGFPRVLSGTVDMGAVEFGSAAVPALGPAACWAAATLMAGAGLWFSRRRRSAVPLLLALSFGVGGAFCIELVAADELGSTPPVAAAATLGGRVQSSVRTIASISFGAGNVQVVFADGATFQVPRSALQITNEQSDFRRLTRAGNGPHKNRQPQAGDVAVVRMRLGPEQSIRRFRMTLVDDAGAGQRMLEGQRRGLRRSD